MKLLDRYVFAEWLKIFAVSIFVTLGIMILHEMYNHLGDLINWGATTSDIIFYYLYFIPTLVPVILPISLLLSLIYILGDLHKNNEITAMRSSGMNVFRITRSLWFAGFLLAGLLLWLNASAIPYCKEQSRTIYDGLRLSSEIKADISNAGVIKTLCFNNRKDGRFWFTNSFSQATNEAKGARVSVLDNSGREVSRVMARLGVFDVDKNCWYFEDGQEITYDAQTHRVEKAVGFDKKYYQDFTEEPRIMILSTRRLKDLSLYETKMIIDSFGQSDAFESKQYYVRWYSIWASAFTCVIVVAIAIPFSVAGVRTNPMVGVSKTVGLFFFYFVLESVISALGGRGFIDPFWAATIPVLFMLIFALSLYRKAI